MPCSTAHRPGLDVVAGIHRARRVGRRHEHEKLRARRARRLELLDGDLEASLLCRLEDNRRRAREPDRFGVRRPVRRGQQRLVTLVEQREQGVVHGVLAAVGHEHLRGRHLVPRIASGLRGDRLSQLGKPGDRAVLVVLRIAAGFRGSLDDVGRCREVRLTGAETDDRLAGGLQGLGLGVNCQGGRRRDGRYALRDRTHHPH